MQRLSPTVAARMPLVPLSFGETRTGQQDADGAESPCRNIFITPPPPPTTHPRPDATTTPPPSHHRPPHHHRHHHHHRHATRATQGNPGLGQEDAAYLQSVGGDPKLIERLKRLLDAAAPILGLAGAILGLYVFARGKLLQVALAERLFLVRILHRFETSGMKDQLERILRELTDPSLTRPLEEEVRRSQRRDPRGRFEKKEPGEEPPGRLHEKEVCRGCANDILLSTTGEIRRYWPRMGMPGQPAPARACGSGTQKPRWTASAPTRGTRD